MRGWIRTLGALWLSVVVLIVLSVALAAGTLIESSDGAEAAAAAVYGVSWFRFLLALFGLNTACALIDRWPWGKLRIGFVITHLSMVVILVGAWMTDTFKIEGKLPLWEGETSDTFYAQDGPSSEHQEALGFAVRLDDFELGRYPGTMRPSQFRSHLTILPKDGPSFEAKVQMNEPLHHGGWSFFQSSYQQERGREMTVLSVSRDPGQAVVFVGYALLVFGMCWVLGTRIVMRRMMLAAQKMAEQAAAEARAARGEEPESQGKGHKKKGGAKVVAVVALLGLTGAFALSASPIEAQMLPGAATAERLRRLPIQHDGRAMPLDTMAREMSRKVTGRVDAFDPDPVRLILGWCFDPQGWSAAQVIKIGSQDLAAQIGMDRDQEHGSFASLAGNQRLMKLLDEAEHMPDKGKPSVHKAAEALSERLVAFQGFLKGDALRVEPVKDPLGKWTLPKSVKGADDLLSILDAPPQGVDHYPSLQAIERELLYNEARPSRLAWFILLPAAILAALTLRRPRTSLDIAAALGLLAGFGVMSWGLGLRWIIAGRIPASNMYESMLFLAWGVGFFALIASLFLRNRMLIFNASAMSAVTMVLIDLLPMDAFIHPMPPVLSGTPWLAIHVPIIMVSYSVLALGVLVAHMQIGVSVFSKRPGDLVAKLNDLLYWYIFIGSILLIAGILTGSIWAASSWGRYWGWDPKEVWSLIAFLAYMAILHGRFDRLIGPFGVAAYSIGAFWTILMTYLGVNYVLAAGLHSYGFGGSDVVTWMIISGLAEIAFLAAGFAARKRVAA